MAERQLASVTAQLEELDQRAHAATSFAEELRQTHRRAAEEARTASAVLRDRETQLARMLPLRAQYADDLLKLQMLAQARQLFDPLRVRSCPACLHPLSVPPQVAEGHCSMCDHDLPVVPDLTLGAAADSLLSTEAEQLDVAAEIRSTKARLKEMRRSMSSPARMRSRILAASARSAAISRASSPSEYPLVSRLVPPVAGGAAVPVAAIGVRGAGRRRRRWSITCGATCSHRPGRVNSSRARVRSWRAVAGEVAIRWAWKAVTCPGVSSPGTVGGWGSEPRNRIRRTRDPQPVRAAAWVRSPPAGPVRSANAAARAWCQPGSGSRETSKGGAAAVVPVESHHRRAVGSLLHGRGGCVGAMGQR